MLLIAPTIIPIAWLTSSTLHLVESYPVLESCVLDVGDCPEALVLLGLIVAVILCVCSSRILREHSPLQITHLAYEHPLSRRIDALCAQHHSLHALNVRVASNCAIPVFTTGWLRPRVIIDACFVQSADDAMLLATLLHESAHVQRRDGLCHLLVKLSFALNPASRWMHADYMHWRHALEARCDYDAIVKGGEPLALAQSIVCRSQICVRRIDPVHK